MIDVQSKIYRSPIPYPQSRIQHFLLLFLLIAPAAVFAAPDHQAPAVQSGAWTHSEVDDWLSGAFTNTFVDGGAIRLQEGQTGGEYLSAPLQAPFGFNAGVAQWTATVPDGAALRIEVRSSVDGQTWDEWRAAQATTSPSQAQATSQLFVFRPFTSYLQYRAAFTAVSASPIFNDITLTYISSTAGPGLSDIVGRVPLSGPPSLTPAPVAVARAEWAGTALTAGARQQPQRVELAQVPAPVDDPNPLAMLRALLFVHESILNQPDLPYHYLIDGQGNIYEGVGSATRRIEGVEDGTARIAVLGNAEAEGVSEAAQARLIDLLGWLSASYGVDQNAIEGAADAPQRLKDVAVELRPAIARAVIRSRTLFAEGSTGTTTERLVLFNPTATEASATFTAFTANGEERRSVVVPPRRRVDVTLNAVLPDATSLGLDLQADRRLIAERTLIAGRELLGSLGASEPSRAWYFSAGSTVSDTATLLSVVNPQAQEVAATLTLYPDGTAPVTQTTTFAPRSRTSLRLNDLIPDAEFGLKLATSQPVVAERTMLLPGGAADLATGVARLSPTWSFAEGSTTDGFSTTLHVLNPWPQQVAIALQIMSEDGTSLSRRYAVPAQSRFTLALSDVVPGLPFAMQLEAERPVAAERIMLGDEGAIATATAGATAPATRWTFAEGSTAEPAEQLLLLNNPQREAVRLQIEYVLADGTVERREHAIAALARLTLVANNDVPDQPVITTIITADQPIVAERSIYVTGADGRGAETSLGVPGR